MSTCTTIPKVIHYCWFGNKEKPKFIKRCIESWKIQLSDYEIMEWNESNFDINMNNFVKQAYEAGKFAFVSDYARVYALYNYGGIYLDTDVEVIKNFDSFLHHSSFWGFEEKNYIATSTIGSIKGNPLIKKFLDEYEDKSFILSDGSYDISTNVSLVTETFEELGIKRNGLYQELKDLAVVYPKVYFSPYDYINCISHITDKSYAVHHFYKSWVSISQRIKFKIKKILADLIGGENIAKLREKNTLNRS